MPTKILLLKQFLVFGCVSALGWLCDFGTFTLLVKLFDVHGFIANFVSSYVGITFVWFTSLQTVFGRTGAARGRFLLAYWGFQFVSILAYSQLLHLVAAELNAPVLPAWLQANDAVAAKIIITPFNLVTNFLFMKWLTRFMQQASPAQS